jgi:hypothetical protein
LRLAILAAVITAGCGKRASPAPLSPEIPTEAATAAFAPKLAAAIHAKEGGKYGGGTFAPIRIDLRKTDSLLNPVVAVITVRRDCDNHKYDFVTTLGRKSGRWIYLESTVQLIPDGPAYAAEKYHPWVVGAVDDAQQ